MEDPTSLCTVHIDESHVPVCADVVCLQLCGGSLFYN